MSFERSSPVHLMADTVWLTMEESTELRRQVGLLGAVLLGLGSIIGTGVFVTLGLAVAAVQDRVVWAVSIAALVALCNGLSSARLAANHPTSGGTYEYGYEYIHPTVGFAAGWMFLVAKSASAGTAAIGIAAYAGVEGRLVSLGVVAVVTVVVLAGVRRSNQLNAVIVGVAVAALAAVVGLGFRGPGGVFLDPPAPGSGSLLGASALIFVAFTGYGRVATLGEEVIDPARTIPRAVVVTLGATTVIYAAVALTQAAWAPFNPNNGSVLASIAGTAGGPGWASFVRVGALAALVGVLLNLVLGLSRVALAMGRRGDLPGAFARINTAGTTPVVSVIGVGVLVGGFALLGDLRGNWSFAAVTVLIYYSITNIAALRLPPSDRAIPLAVPILGLVGCVGLAAFIEPKTWAAAAVVLMVGVAWHLLRRRLVGSGSVSDHDV